MYLIVCARRNEAKEKNVGNEICFVRTWQCLIRDINIIRSFSVIAL